ncbi:hypothetical protein H6G97_35495 [Nostoc flagelliforme FACHB-838]|uniref:Uncharacterized protein n=1 Tax=Nostoc flagelliforme FACHB-838 TaxID=2692904 RepID=A0ABR8E1N8_9NOSO|nr:hypothetical protein [Nostoc flagelliforme]MBD2534508.1 hypothetical protein [Nostoc flagelliforme FACHB-838]
MAYPPPSCDRLACGYYQVSLHGEDLGDWSELRVLAVLSGLQQEFYRGRLPGLAVGFRWESKADGTFSGSSLRATR